ncbi:MAG: hypothetical protein EOM20_15370 [Spartobacteria bacterium]|nr:hypothetical protein [Spartobacteria bacterium]
MDSQETGAVVPEVEPSDVRHQYPLAVRSASFGVALGLFMKTLPYALARFGVLLVVSIITIIWGVITLGGAAWLGNRVHETFGLVWGVGGVAAYGGFWVLVVRYVLYMIKCGHIVVLTDLVTTGQIGNGTEGMFAYGRRVVRERFVQVNVLFGMDRLLDGVIRSFNRTLDWVSSLIPIPGLEGLMNIVKAILYSASTYLDETIFSYILARKETNPWRGGQDGLIYYCQNAKSILKTAIWVVILDKVCTVLLWVLMLLPALAVTHLIGGAAGGWAIVIAILFAANARSAFLKPLFLIMVMTTFHVCAEGQSINLEWDARLTKLSGKFKQIKDKAAAWIKPSAAA